MAKDPAPETKSQEAKIGLSTYCLHKKHQLGIFSRMKAALADTGGADEEKTISEWDSIYEKEMKRVTN